ncbi:Lanthionine synthetase C-like protein [Streptomyces rubrolavendulae]|uniref:Lanthionine synthetase C-like protein n=1 Tax=Streptomyces rubrolavendulae TaxID=285473 RepID=A0A1D8GAE4_9ACTN|nr:Lanthionine synthetase C-like protein [Streptomyces rubrolavendulae]
MCPAPGSGSFVPVTDTALARETRLGPLPAAWWAPGLTLRERLAAPDAPAAPPAPGARTRVPWGIGDADGFTGRLASLGVGEDIALALAAEPAGRLAARTGKPEWARFVEGALTGRAGESAPGGGTGARDGAADGAYDGERGGGERGGGERGGRAHGDGPAGQGAPGGPGREETRTAAGADVFAPVLRPLVAAAWAAAAALPGAATALSTVPADTAAARTAFTALLDGRLAHQAARTLVTELHRARDTGLLAGATPEERFASFLDGLRAPGALAALLGRYPVLARMLGETCLHTASATAELLGRYAEDRPAIVAGLCDGADPGPLVRVDLDRGDAHQGGRSVALLRFADGRTVVYKPRPLDQHVLLDRAVDWLNAKAPGLALRTPRTLLRSGHGWMEFIEHRWCRTPLELDRFYRRQGALLALLYALDAVDMHYENVIAQGDQPLLVDAETLLHADLPQAATAGPDPAAEALRVSVHRTCLLPSLLIGDNGALDISGLGGADGEAYPSDGMRWEAAGTDEMRMVRGPVPSAAAQNRPVPEGRPVRHADHRAALLEGFRDAYGTIAAHRDELLGGLLDRWADGRGRLIARPTRLYATLLEESTHPGVLGDALARESVFSLLWSESELDPARQRLVEHEIADLWAGDVPFFAHRPALSAVWTARGTRLDGLLPRPALDAARDKIAAMGEVDRYDQEWIVNATLAVSHANTGTRAPRSELSVRPATPVAPDASRLLSAACGIADEIAARAVHGDGRVNWLGLEEVAPGHWAVLPMGAGLAQGYCGVALFLAELGALAGARRYTDLARRALRPLPGLLAALAGDPGLGAAAGPGALHGLGGVVYAAARLAPLLDEGLYEALPTALGALERATHAEGPGGLDDDPPTGLADGLAGALAAALAAHRTGAAPGAAALARRLAGRLAGAAAKPTGDPGFARGDAGTGWALLRYAAARPAQPAGTSGPAPEPYTSVGTALLRSALTALPHPAGHLTGSAPTGRATGPDRGTGADRAGAPGADPAGRASGWYAGASGVALAALDALPPAEGALADADHWVRRLDAAGPPADLSLGHGALGELELLAELAGRGHDGARDALTRRTGEVLGGIEQYGHRCGTPGHVPSPGLLTGLSGIGHQLLRLAFPDEVPSVLLLGTRPRG